MILQTDSRLDDRINVYGCYLMSLLWWANKLAGYELDPEKIDGLYGTFVFRDYITEKCFVKRPDKILEFCGLLVEYEGFNSRTTRCKEGQFEIDRWVRPREETGGEWIHFVAGDGRGRVTYDPWGVSRTATEGTLADKRLFTVL